MSSENPYEPPKQPVEVTETRELVLATHGQRLSAALIDGVFGMLLSSPVLAMTMAWAKNHPGQEPPVQMMIVSALIGFALFMALHGYFLRRNGQTLGKRFIGIRIARCSDGGVPVFADLLLRRYLPIWILTLIPGGPFIAFVDTLFIFRPDRRCVHDLLADTRVVKV